MAPKRHDCDSEEPEAKQFICAIFDDIHTNALSLPVIEGTRTAMKQKRHFCVRMRLLACVCLLSRCMCSRSVCAQVRKKQRRIEFVQFTHE